MNIMTQSQYNSAQKSSSELYVITDASFSYNDLTDKPTAESLGAVVANEPITGATKCKIMYDDKGLVVQGYDLQASDIPSLTWSKLSDVTPTVPEVNKLHGLTATTTQLNYTYGVTGPIQQQIDSKQATLVSGTNIKTLNNNSILGSGNLELDGLPPQEGQSGKYLRTNGTTASWEVLNGLTVSYDSINERVVFTAA